MAHDSSEPARIGVDWITISIDGTREVDDGVRGREGSSDLVWQTLETLAAYRRFKNQSQPKLSVTCAISARNQRSLEALVDLFEDGTNHDHNLAHLHFSRRVADFKSKIENIRREAGRLAPT